MTDDIARAAMTDKTGEKNGISTSSQMRYDLCCGDPKRTDEGNQKILAGKTPDKLRHRKPRKGSPMTGPLRLTYTPDELEALPPKEFEKLLEQCREYIEKTRAEGGQPEILIDMSLSPNF